MTDAADRMLVMDLGGVVAKWAFLSPHFRLGKSNAGLPWVC